VNKATENHHTLYQQSRQIERRQMKTRPLFVSLILGLGMTLAFLWLMVAGPMPLVYADTYTVTNTNPSGPGSLRQAILNTNNNAGYDIINFGITGTIVLTDALPAIDDDLTITGPGAEQLAVSGANSYRVFYINSNTAVTITGVTVQDGNVVDDNGGGIWSTGTLYLDSVRIADNTATATPTSTNPVGRGGGVYVSQGNVTLSGTQVVSNSAYRGGGMHVSQGSVTLSGTQVVDNSASYGGGVCVREGSATLNVSGGRIDRNSASSTGGGVCVREGSATLSGTQVVNNSAYYDGGGLYIASDSATLNVSGGRIDNNSASYGAGVFVWDGNATLSETQVISNSAANFGGGVFVLYGNATLIGTQVVDNSASYGGGVYLRWGGTTLNVIGGQIGRNSASYGGGVCVSRGSATLSGTQVVSNSAYYDGGGVHVSEGTVALTRTRVVGNSASEHGGGLFVQSGATLSETQVISNSANLGGGMFLNFSNATLIGTQVVSNSASYGGGMYVDRYWAMLNVSGGRIDGNFASDEGGGVYVFEGKVMLTGTQVVNNLASDGGGVYLYSSGAVTAVNGCIVLNSDTAVNRADGTLIATDNWWGTADGPGGAGPGRGDTVSAGVDYSNFKTVAPMGCPSRSPGYYSTPAPGSTINVGTANVGSTVSTTLTIRETGGETLIVTPTLSGADATNFDFAPTTLTILNGGAAQDLTISCTPSFTGTLAGTLVGTLAATLTVIHNAPDSPAVYPLICTGETPRYIYLPLVLKNN
jgi:hypothetical protein